MGSFNSKCFASGQSIAPDDSCVVMLLQQSESLSEVPLTRAYTPFSFKKPEEGTTELIVEQHIKASYSEGSCDSSSFWRLNSLPIQAKYYDYGKVIPDLSSISNKLAITLLLTYIRANALIATPARVDESFDFLKFEEANNISIFKSKGNSLADDSLNVQIMACWDYVWDAHLNGVLFGTAQYSKTPAPLAFGLVHSVAFDALTQTSGVSNSNSEVLLSAISEAESFILEQNLPDETTDSVKFLYLLDIIQQSLSRLNYNGEVPNISIRPFLKTVLYDYFIVKDFNTLLARLNPLLDSFRFIRGLNYLNLQYLPQVRTRQDYSNQVGKKVASFISEVSSKVSCIRKSKG